MKAPMRWLNEYTKINMPAEEYAKRMIMTGTAVEGWENTSKFNNVVIGLVKTCEEHPDSDHLHVCTVDVGGEMIFRSYAARPTCTRAHAFSARWRARPCPAA